MTSQFQNLSNKDVYQCIKDDILTLKLEPGQYISENEFSKKYNVSRTPIKSAFLRLMSEKFIEILPQRGTYVTLLDLEYIKEIIYMRTVLETEVILTAIDCLEDKVLDKLEDNLKQQEELIGIDTFEIEDFYKLDSEFHFILFDFVKRTKLWEIIQEFQVYYTRFRMLDIVATGSFEKLYLEHFTLYQCVKAKDKEGVKEQLCSHLHGNLDRLSGKIDNELKKYFIN